MSWYARSIGKAPNVARQIEAQLLPQNGQAGHAQVLTKIIETTKAIAAEVGDETVLLVETQGHVSPNYGAFEFMIYGALASDPAPSTGDPDTASDATGSVEG